MKILVDESALRQSMEALEYAQQDRECPSTTRQAITTLRAVLAQSALDPVAVVGTQDDVWRFYNGQWVPPGSPIKMAHMLKELPIGTMLYADHPYRPRCD